MHRKQAKNAPCIARRETRGVSRKAFGKTTVSPEPYSKAYEIDSSMEK